MEQVYTSVPGVLIRDVGGELLLLNSDSELYFALNASGVAMYELLIDGRPTDQIVAEVAERFDVAVERVRPDLEVLVAKLVDKGLIRSDV